MTMTSISTQYLGTAMIPAVMQAQAQVTQLEVESSTGEYADLGLQLGDQSGYELSLRNQNDLLQTLTTANGLTGATMSTAQNALSSLLTEAQTAAQDVTTWTSGTNSGSTLQTLGQSSLQQLISTANTTSGDQYVFGGVNSGAAPMADYYATPTSSAKAAVDQAFQSTFGCLPTDAAASSISASALQSFLTGPFKALFNGTGWSSNWSSASSTNTSAEVAPGQTIDTSTNANTSGFQQLAEGYAMLGEFGGSELNTSAQQTLATTALSSINAGVSSLTATQTELGAAQSQVTQATASMSSQMTILQTQIGNLDNVNA